VRRGGERGEGGAGVELYLRALVFIPQINAVKGIRADNIGARTIRGAIAFHISGHSCLPPLGAIHGRWQWQMFAIESLTKK